MRIFLILLTMALVSCGGEELTDPSATEPIADNSEPKDNISLPPTDNDTTEKVVESTFCQVQKLFDDNCIKCHSETGNKPTLASPKTKTGLVDKKNPGDKYYVRSGSPEESELYLRITHQDESKRMPKFAPRLSDSDIDLVRTWIEDGADTTCP